MPNKSCRVTNRYQRINANRKQQLGYFKNKQIKFGIALLQKNKMWHQQGKISEIKLWSFFHLLDITLLLNFFSFICTLITDIINEMSHTKQIHSTFDIYEEYSKSSSKRLFDSVFKILDHDELQISTFEQSDTNGSRISKFFQNQNFVQAVFDRLKQQLLDQLYPILKVKCKNQKGVLFTMDTDDLHAVFQKFGNIYLIQENEAQSAYFVMFTSFCSAYVAMKLLNNFSIRHFFANLVVQWCNSSQYHSLSHILSQYHLRLQWDTPEALSRKSSSSSSQNSKQCKLTCRYDIQIQNQKDFQVARRIIGSKGTNMKKIIQSSLEQVGQKNSNNSNEILKLRLRGKGSGYKEGPEQMQSQEQLHLCISAKDEIVYNFACQSVQKLLKNVYSQYQQYTKKVGKTISLTIKKNDISTQFSSSINNENMMRNVDLSNSGRMEPEKIQHFLELRNKARRQLNFSEADRIRNYLRACGVCLIDQKGRRGKAAEVTTWKYLL